MIQPTVGRVVWYTPSEMDRNYMAIHDGQPLAAMVAYVWNDRMVNLTVSDHNGSTFGRTSVPLLQDGDDRPSHFFAEWMPFQKGQAAKTEQLQKELAK